MTRRKVVILGAAGRDFHDFNVVYRSDPSVEVIAFTAAQIPDIDGRVYPAELAGKLYPEGVPIVAESGLAELISERGVHEVVFGYSDVSHEHVMHAASLALSSGADFRLLAHHTTALEAGVPVISVCAVRTGSGKSQTTRRVAGLVKASGRRVVVIRHAMPYGDLTKQAVQRFERLEDLDHNRCTLEEREEYEPHVRQGTVVYAGIDYERIVRRAEGEADIIVWDGGNNDTPFVATDLHIVVVDPLRPGHEVRYHPGETNLRMADVVVVNKVDSASAAGLEEVRRNASRLAPTAEVVLAESLVTLEDGETLEGKTVLVVEDGPTVTHGEMPHGAGYVAAVRFGAVGIADPRAHAVGSIRELYERYPHIGPVLPAVGYSAPQIADLAATIDATPADVVLVATPVDLSRVASLSKPVIRVGYELNEVSTPGLSDIIERFFAERG